MYFQGKCCGRIPISERHLDCSILCFFTVWWIPSHLSAFWVVRGRVHRSPGDFGWVGKEGDCQTPQLWVIFDPPLEAGLREEEKKFQEGKHLLLLLANIWNSTTGLMQPYSRENGLLCTGPSICRCFPEQEADLRQLLSYSCGVISPWGGGWSEYRSGE